MTRVWRIPVKRNIGTDHWIHRGAKYHAFINNKSICGKYKQNIGFVESSIAESDVRNNPDLACKKCLELLKSAKNTCEFFV